MSTAKRKRRLFAFVAVATALVILIAGFLVIHYRLLSEGPRGLPTITPVLSNVYLNSSVGFNSTFMFTHSLLSTLYVLPPGGTGTIPFSVYSPANVPFNVSFSTYLDSPDAKDYGLRFSFSPSNLTVNPGEHNSSVLTATASREMPNVFYLGSVGIETDKEQSPYFIGGGAVNIPALLIANATPACIYYINGFDLAPPITLPITVHPQGTYNLAIPLILNMSAGEETQFIFCNNIKEQLTLNTTAPAGITAQFSQAPTDIILSYTNEREMHALNLKVDPNTNPGTYNVQLKGIVGEYRFEGTLTILVK